MKWRRTGPSSAISDCGRYRITAVYHGHVEQTRYEAWRVGFEKQRTGVMLDHFATKDEAIAACVADAQTEVA